MFEGMYRRSDPYNLLKKRNIKNSSKRDFNCAGYALGCFSWFNFSDFDNMSINECVEEILANFPNIRFLRDEKELKENEYLIAFRMGKEDFHFMKRNKRNIWYEKRGHLWYINTVKKKTVYSPYWKLGNIIYDSQIVFFANKM